MDFTDKLKTIKNDLYAKKPSRINHIEGVAECALELKRRHFPEIPDFKILQAAYMHDFTKEYDIQAHIEILNKYNMPLDGYEEITPKLLHSKSAYAIAAYEYKLDEDVCLAVLYHTTGRENMTPLEKIIYLADYIEKNRTYVTCTDVRDTYELLVEKQHKKPMEEAILYSLDLTIGELIEKKLIIHRDTIQARNYLIKEGI